MTKNFRMPQGLADDLRFIQLLNSGGLVNELARLMNEAGRIEEFISSTSDPALQQRLMAEFGLTVGRPEGA